MSTITFIKSGGFWEVDKNWSHPAGQGARVPGGGDDVILPGGVTVEMRGNLGADEVHSIQIGAGARLNVVNQDAINKSSPAIFDAGGSNAGTIQIALESVLSIDGAFANTGAILVGEGGTLDSAHADYLNMGGSPLTGGGTVVLKDGWVQGALTNVDNTISGYGFMGNGDANGITFALDNRATIDADGFNINGFNQALVIQAGATVIKNTGLLEATNPTNHAVTGGLSLFGDTIDNVGGVIEATGAHTHVDLSSTTVSGGTLETRQGGVITFDATSLLDGRGAHPLTIDGALVVNDGAYLNVAGHINLLAADDSDILLNSKGTRANLVIATTGAILGGGGRVTLGGLSSDQILGAGAGATLTLADATLEGAGHIGGNLRIVNQKGGVIDADSTAGQLVIDTNTLVFQNAGLLEARGGGSLSLSETTIDSAGGRLLAGSNSTVTLEASTLIGGVMATIGTGAIQAHGVSVLDGRTSTITNQGLFRVIDGADLTIEGTIANTGIIALGDNNGANAIVRIAGATLTGGGTFKLNDGADGKLVIGLTPTSTLTNVDNTIIGAGQLSDGQLTLVNQANGVIDADRAGALVIDSSHGGSVTNDGLIEATGKGGLVLTNTTVDNSGGGTFHAGNGAVLRFQTTTVTGGTFTTAGTGVIAGFASDTLDGRASAIQNEGLFLVMDGGDVTLEGSIVNTGTLAMGDHTGSNAFLRISPSTTLTGGGTLKLNDGADGKFVVGQTAASTLTNVDNTISGAGQLGDTQLTLINQAKGVINANGTGALVIDTGSGSVTNAGLIEATGKGGLLLSNTTVNNSAGTILAAAGSTVSLSTATVVGGLIESVGTGAVQVTLQSILDGQAHAVTLKGHFNVLNNQTVLVEGAIKNTGTISIQDAGTFTALRLAANTTLSGGGKLVLSDSDSNFVLGASTTTLTNVDNTISGAGQLSDTQMRLVNQSAGVINANGAHALVIESGGAQSTANDDVNSGLMEATGKGGLTISLTTIDQSGGGTILAGANSSVLLSLSELVGGTLNTAGNGVIDLQGLNILDGSKSTVTNLGSVKVLDGGALEMKGKLNNAGSVSLNGTGHPSTFLSINAVLSGGGTLQMGDSSENIVEGATATETLTNIDNTIVGAGHLGNGQMVLRNQAAGVIDGTLSAGLVIDTGTSAIANAGLIEAGAGGAVTINSAVNNTGVIEANGGVVTVNAKVTGVGKMLINGGTLDLTQTTLTNKVAFAGTAGTLRLDQSQTFHGQVSGFSKTGGETLDLSDIGFVSVSEAKFVENKAKTAGVLTVSDGTHTAKISLLGDYSGLVWTSHSDGHGGTAVSAGPAPGPHALVQAVAALGGGAAGAAQSPTPEIVGQPSLVLNSGQVHGRFG